MSTASVSATPTAPELAVPTSEVETSTWRSCSLLACHTGFHAPAAAPAGCQTR